MLDTLIFDVDGTLADTESLHCAAFNAAFAAAGLNWYWDESLYTRLLNVAGGRERLMHYWRSVDPDTAARSAATIDRLHADKTRRYATALAAGALPLRPGVRRLIECAPSQGIRLAIATTTTGSNIDALLRGPFGSDWRDRFAVICDGSTPGLKKPAPDVYQAVLSALSVDPADCLALEDSRNGMKAARAAGIPVLVTPTSYTALHDFSGAMLVLPHLGDPSLPMDQLIPGAEHRWVDLPTLRRWHHGTLFEAA